MARIAGVDLPREKRVQVGLTYVYGIGQTTAKMCIRDSASTAKHPSVEIPASNMKKAICQILVDEGYIKGMPVSYTHLGLPEVLQAAGQKAEACGLPALYLQRRL